ncbi:MAG: AAA domain-containing protein [Catenulispora sp.]|nr:AAA domain-containing protein [Catenulispora sp.]
MTTPTLAPPGIPAPIAAASPAPTPITATTPAIPPAPAPGSAARPKAGPGELRAEVAAILANNHGIDFSVGDLAKYTKKSGGAIGNACETLVRRGEADRFGTGTRRYTANANTAAAAAQAVITPPGQGRPRPARPTPAPSPAPAAPPTTPAPRTYPPVKGPITRPNGALYYPRVLAGGLSDVEALRKLRESSIPALLYGPPGTGKTSVIEAAFPDLITIAGDGDTQVSDLIGEYTQNERGGYEFVYGPLVTAMTEGRALLIDDATLISPKVLAALYPALDGRRQITVKAHKGEVITAADSFYVIAGHNPGVHGAILTEALASRFSTQILVETDYDLCKRLGIDSRAVTLARNLSNLAKRGDLGWCPQLRELIAFQKIAEVLGIDAAFANLVGITPVEDRDQVAELVAKTTGAKVAALAVGKQI